MTLCFIRLPNGQTRSEIGSFPNYVSGATSTRMAKWVNLITTRSPKVCSPKRSEVKKGPLNTSINQ